MKKIFTILLISTLSLISALAQERFSITLSVDSAIASQPQQVYLYSQIEREMQLHDSISIDSVHRQGTLYGTVPYEYNVNLMFSRRGPGIVPVVVKNGDRMKIHVGDEDDGFNIRYIDKVGFALDAGVRALLSADGQHQRTESQGLPPDATLWHHGTGSRLVG